MPLLLNPDHAAIFTDPSHLVAGPLKKLGYVAGWDNRCYPSPVDEHDYINVPSGLPADSPSREKGWFDYVAVVHPVDEEARKHMLSQGYGTLSFITSPGELFLRIRMIPTLLIMRE